MGIYISAVVKVHREGIVVLPKSIRNALGIAEGVLLKVRIEAGKLFLNYWNCGNVFGAVQRVLALLKKLS